MFGIEGYVEGATDHFDQARGVASTMTPEGDILVTERGQTYLFRSRPLVRAGAGGAAADGAILSPMPGRIIAVEVAAGERVAKGQKLVTLEAMKMEHSLVAPFDGTVADLDTALGAQVSEGKLLARVERDG